MGDPYFQQLFAERIGGANYGKGTEIYKFEKIKRAKRKALAEHPERKLIDFGIGENDEMAPESVRAVMAREISRPENRGYADNGIAAYKEAAARFMQRNFGVELDPTTEVNHCIGSKPALAMRSSTLRSRRNQARFAMAMGPCCKRRSPAPAEFRITWGLPGIEWRAFDL